MAIFYVALSNPYFKVGEYVEDQGDGFAQRVRMKYRDGGYEPGGWFGLCVPINLVRPSLIRIQKSGLDPEVRRAGAA